VKTHGRSRDEDRILLLLGTPSSARRKAARKGRYFAAMVKRL
jgi:hypothetical protein